MFKGKVFRNLNELGKYKNKQMFMLKVGYCVFGLLDCLVW